MRQGCIKQIISLIQSNIGDFQVGEQKTIDRFIYSWPLVFTMLLLFSPKPSLKSCNGNNVWKRETGVHLGFAVLSTSSGTWDKLLLFADSISSFNWEARKKGASVSWTPCSIVPDPAQLSSQLMPRTLGSGCYLLRGEETNN